MKKIILIALLAALVLVPSQVFAYVGVVTINSQKVVNGFGWVDVRVDSVDGNATAVISPAFSLVNPQWTYWGYAAAVTPFVYLPIGTQFSSTTTDSVHVGIETSADASSWYAFTTATVQTTVHNEGTPRVQYLLLPSARYMRVKFYAKTTDVIAGKLIISYPSK
jgi:hypothetical protein